MAGLIDADGGLDFGTGLAWLTSGIGGSGLDIQTDNYLPQSLALFDEMVVPPSTERKIIINAMISSLIDSGVWEKLDVLYVLAAHDSQAALLNWKQPGTRTATAVSAPTFTADRGFTGNGSTSYLNTGYVPSTNGVQYTLNDASVATWCLTNVQSNARAIGSNTSPLCLIVPRANTDNVIVSINSGSTSTIGTGGTMTTSVGMTLVRRTAGSNLAVFKNGSSYGTAVAAPSAVSSAEQWIGAANNSSFSTVQTALAAWGASLSGLESSFYTASLTYMQGVGAA